MKPDSKLIKTVWKSNAAFVAKSVVDLDSIKFDELLGSIFSNGPFYFYIVDFFDMKIKYMSPMVKDIHGLDAETTSFQDILDQIHPDDMPFVAKAERICWDMLFNKLDSERNRKYKVSYCFRFKTSDGSYQLFNHQSVILTTDKNGGLSKSLNVHTNISHLTSENNYQVSAIGMFGEPSYLNIGNAGTETLPPPTKSIFSKREVEIIRLMSEGLTNAIIADKLFITHHTVKSHRKNILRKAKCKNMPQLITKCISEGLI